MLKNAVPSVGVLVSRYDHVELHPNDIVGRSDFMVPGAHSGAVAVIEDGKLVGILTGRDLLKKALGHQRDLNTTKVADVMTRNPLSVPASATLKEALDVITSSGFSYLPVVNGDSYVGMLDVRDLYMEIQRLLEQQLENQERAYVSMFWEPYGYTPPAGRKNTWL